jgi:type I restriction-modification system DNA methylase subunit
MAKRKSGSKKAKGPGNGENGGIVALTKELFQAAITLRGSVEPADYKRYVLPIIFLRFLSLRYDRRRAELEALVADKNSDYYGDKTTINDLDEYRRVGAFVIPEAARWKNIRKAAQADDIKVKLDDVLESLENQYPDKLKGLLPRIYAGSNMDAVSVRGLINLFSKDTFEADHGGEDLIGRVYEYFIGEFASSEGKRGGEYFTPVSIVKTLVAMLEPEKGVVFDPCCGSGGMFVQSDLFTKHSHQLSFVGHGAAYHRRGPRADQFRTASRGNRAAVLPSPDWLSRNRRSASRGQPGIHRDEVRQASLSSLRPELDSREPQ